MPVKNCVEGESNPAPMLAFPDVTILDRLLVLALVRESTTQDLIASVSLAVGVKFLSDPITRLSASFGLMTSLLRHML